MYVCMYVCGYVRTSTLTYGSLPCTHTHLLIGELASKIQTVGIPNSLDVSIQRSLSSCEAVEKSFGMKCSSFEYYQKLCFFAHQFAISLSPLPPPTHLPSTTPTYVLTHRPQPHVLQSPVHLCWQSRKDLCHKHSRVIHNVVVVHSTRDAEAKPAVALQKCENPTQCVSTPHVERAEYTCRLQ